VLVDRRGRRRRPPRPGAGEHVEVAAQRMPQRSSSACSWRAAPRPSTSPSTATVPPRRRSGTATRCGKTPPATASSPARCRCPRARARPAPSSGCRRRGRPARA
jgi:hypothetical protein